MLEDLEKRLPNLVKVYRKLGKELKEFTHPKGNFIQKMLSYPTKSLKVGFNYIHATILTSHNALVIADEIQAIENAVRILTKWSHKLESKDGIKIIAMFIGNYLIKKLLRGTSEYLLTKRYGLILFIISALIFVVLEIFVDCKTHEHILRITRGIKK